MIASLDLIDPRMGEKRLDGLVEVDTVDAAFALALILPEHKSWVDRDVALQLLDYSARCGSIGSFGLPLGGSLS